MAMSRKEPDRYDTSPYQRGFKAGRGEGFTEGVVVGIWIMLIAGGLGLLVGWLTR